jgi:hypothetical protein
VSRTVERTIIRVDGARYLRQALPARALPQSVHGSGLYVRPDIGGLGVFRVVGPLDVYSCRVCTSCCGSRGGLLMRVK